eukprot:768204-Hanusia_phi.AAC.4
MSLTKACLLHQTKHLVLGLLLMRWGRLLRRGLHITNVSLATVHRHDKALPAAVAGLQIAALEDTVG